MLACRKLLRSTLPRQLLSTNKERAILLPSGRCRWSSSTTTTRPRPCACHNQPKCPSTSMIQRSFADSAASEKPETVPIIFVEADGTEREVQAEIGQSLLEVAHSNNVELEGACGGELACSTCHLIFPQDIYDTLDPMEDDEEDMLDLAFELTETSRLGCQIPVREDFAGMKVRIPDDGF